MHSLGFPQFCKVADTFVKAPGVIYFWRRKALFERLKRELPRGILPKEIFKQNTQKRCFPAFLEAKYQFPKQGWSSLTQTFFKK